MKINRYFLPRVMAQRTLPFLIIIPLPNRNPNHPLLRILQFPPPFCLETIIFLLIFLLFIFL